MNTFNWKRLLPVFAAIALFYTLSLVYFSPVLEGKKLVQSDIKNWQGMAQEVAEHRAKFDEEPLWTGSMFSGMPAYQIFVQWPSNLLLKVDKVFRGFLPRPADFLFLYLMGMFILLLCLRVDPWLAIVGAVAFGFSSYFFVILEAGHTSKANAIGYMPMVLGAMHMLYRRRLLLGGALLALFMGLEISTNHVQVTYYLGILLLLFALAEGVRAIREKQLPDFLKRSGVGLVAVILGLACNVGMLWTTYEYGKLTTRGQSELTIRSDGSSAEDIRTEGLDRDYVTDWSYGKAESLTLLVPDAKGGATSALANHPEALSGLDQRYRQNIGQMNAYWGDQRFTSGPVYLGSIVVLLMLLMLVRTEAHGRWWLLASVPVVAALIGINDPMLSGALVIVYLLAGLWLMRDTLTYALFGALFLTLLLSWGRNLMPLTDFFLDHIPGYDKFRAVTIILVIVELAAPVLAVLYLDRFIRDGGWDKIIERKSLITMGVVLVLLLAMAVTPNLFSDFISTQEREAFNEQIDSQPQAEAQIIAGVEQLKLARQHIFTSDAWRSFAFVLAGSVLLFLFGRRKIGKPVLLGVLGVLVLLDLWTVDKRYVNNEKDRGRYMAWEEVNANKFPFQANAADKAIMEAEWTPAAEADLKTTMDRLKAERAHESGRDKMVLPEEEMLARYGSLRRNSDYRVLNLNNPFQDARVSYFHKSLGGYHGAKLKKYQDLIEFHLGPAIQRIGTALQSGSIATVDSALAQEGVLNMLNTRYMIYNPERPPIRNVNALGSAWFVEEVKWAKNADEEIVQLGTIDPATTALIDERYREALGTTKASADPSANVSLDEYRTNKLTYTVNSSNGGVVVFSEIWYGPDWQATLDGKPVDYARADYVLRAMAVPPGDHTVVFSVVGKAYNASQGIALASSALLILLVLGALFMEVKRTMRDPEAEA